MGEHNQLWNKYLPCPGSSLEGSQRRTSPSVSATSARQQSANTWYHTKSLIFTRNVVHSIRPVWNDSLIVFTNVYFLWHKSFIAEVSKCNQGPLVYISTQVQHKLKSKGPDKDASHCDAYNTLSMRQMLSIIYIGIGTTGAMPSISSLWSHI